MLRIGLGYDVLILGASGLDQGSRFQALAAQNWIRLRGFGVGVQGLEAIGFEVSGLEDLVLERARLRGFWPEAC